MVGDALLWGLLAVPVLCGDQFGLGVPRPWWRTAAGLLLLAVAVAGARRHPVAALLLVAGGSLLTSPALFTISYGPALSVVAYLLGRRAPSARPALLAFGAVAAAGTVLVLTRPPQDPVVAWLLLIVTLLFGAVFPWLVGRHRRQDRALVAAGWSRAAQLEREQEIVADRVRLRERARIAQDMHDSLGHDLSLIALRAGALQVAPGLDEAHRAAAGELRAAASAATERLREVIGLLRDADAAPLAPAGESVAALVGRAAESGLPVRLVGAVRVRGSGIGDEAADGRGAGGGVPPLAERAAYRVVQESLTNAAKHAPGAEVTVTIAQERAETVVTVTNGPPPRMRKPMPTRTPTRTPVRMPMPGAAAGTTPVSAAPGTGPGAGAGAGPGIEAGTGTGLLGLRERVRLLGGTFSAGPHDDGGFRVLARLPHGTGQAAAPITAEPQPVPEPPAAHAYAQARRATRRGLVVSLCAAGALAVLVVAGAFGWYAYTRTHAVMDPDDFAALRIGRPYAEVEPVLPDLTATDPPTERAPAPPPGADCRYYRASGELFVSVDHFRLCFREGRLVSKTVVPGAAGVPSARTEE
ncbi:sensor histidine kinase [Streptomyces sp. XD-27]|uniref:sensor histidine kinase n=1 Tax=Streptomyces sp. XD-27 TaxID=3062779 RepID=UPI0026F46262|nr:histidine kinase [Streptomyces sp. XD-27]WKX71825.1 histidine kinase [Streptomyces sp. XD-27]